MNNYTSSCRNLYKPQKKIDLDKSSKGFSPKSLHNKHTNLNMPKAKSTKTKTKGSKKGKASKKTKASAATETPPEETVDASEVTLTEEEPAPAAPTEAADSSAAEDSPTTTTESTDPHQQTLDKLQSLMDFEKAIWQQAQKHHRTVIQGIQDAMKLVRASRGRKRKSTGAKKGTNSNSGIGAQRNISKEMRSFLSSVHKKHKSFEVKDTYNYPQLCKAVMTYGNSEYEDLQGMKVTNDAGEESVNNSYIRLDSKLTKLFPDFDTHSATAAKEGKKTFLKDGKHRWVNRAGVNKLISPHLLEIVPTPSSEATGDAVETASA